MQIRSIKIILLVLSLILVTAVFAGCGAAALARPETLVGDPTYNVTGNCDLEINDGVITVSGQTDLMDGALLCISVNAQSGTLLDFVTITKSGDEISQDFIMTDEIYDESVVSVMGFILCVPKTYGEQPEYIYNTYGDDFRFIHYEGEIWDRDGIIVRFASDLYPLEKE
ncbi:MAG: hypothetical protein PHO15_04135 [Eubacteriales bacterium]|nr:hypothetical protein [Eubacteriales bacterium]